ncbi:aldehyde dehydrogenase family protein [Yanshouia hominis]|uniref:Aldehyde dehydrogenase family protein n=1 Tax=Yanshouia hominis TaxID=2763673 RepID=A0ABR7NMC9_9FIRM|nr:aldehyde dehydrogenase family protein [Yanshouia hominis]MBC8577568.1 aldehyde dehydrogenase family protein [Yanshouia hominis]
METQVYLESLVAAARKAQQEFETYSQERVDAACRSIGKVIYDNAELLAHMAVDETGMGNYTSKIAKCKGKSKTTWLRMKGKKSRGIIEWDEKIGIAKVAKPIGVIGSVTPTTNPVITLMHNSMCSLKCGNAIILCPHPRAKKVGAKVVELMNGALEQLDMPQNLIQIIPEPTMELSAGLMSAVDLCICTGGPSMVKAAYSSGKPAMGVGQGNVQVLVDRDVDLNEVAQMVLTGRTFDNGVLCTCEQNVIVPQEKRTEMLKAFADNGAYVIDDEENAERLRECVFPGGVLNKNVVGANPDVIGEMAGIPVPPEARAIVCRTKGYAREDSLSKEKLFPVLAVFTYDRWEDCVEIARANLEMEGAGHSCVIHSNTKKHIEYVPTRVNVSRYAVNQIGGTGLGGALDNGLNPTTTLGCGTWGNNVISENLYYHNLMNVSRISYRIKDAVIPTDEEIWEK